jgi:hypothetical protein
VRTLIAVAVAAGASACTTYGGPPDHPEPPHVAAPSCRVGVVMAEQHYEVLGMDTQATAAELIATLRTVGWFREVDHESDLSGPADFRIRVRVRSAMLNEPYLAVLTLGLVPNPLFEAHGYELALLDAQDAVVRPIDTLYRTDGSFGWLAPLVALWPNQFLAPPTERHARYVAHLLTVEAPELLEPCAGSG